MSESDLSQRFESIDKLVRFLKIGIGAVAAVAVWATTVQLTISGQQKQIDRIDGHTDLFQQWRILKETTDAKQDILISQLTAMQATQQQQISGMLTREPINTVRAER